MLCTATALLVRALSAIKLSSLFVIVLNLESRIDFHDDAILFINKTLLKALTKSPMGPGLWRQMRDIITIQAGQCGNQSMPMLYFLQIYNI
jgi:hypothetical protein